MELIFPKRNYTINQAVARATKAHGDRNIVRVIEAGDKELNHIIEVR